MSSTQRPTAPRLLAGLAVGSVAAIGLTGCANLDVYAAMTGETEFSWSTAKDARESDERFRIPEFLPDDATDITIAVDLRDPGAVLRWTSESGITADYCEASEILGDSIFTADWWPEIPAEGWDCGRWIAFEHEGEFYAWDQIDDV